MRVALRTIAKRPRLEVRLEDRFQDQLERPLDHPVTDRRESKGRGLLPPSFGISFFRVRSGT